MITPAPIEPLIHDDPDWIVWLRFLANIAAALALIVLLPLCIHAYFSRPQGALPHALPHQGASPVSTPLVPSHALPGKREREKDSFNG